MAGSRSGVATLVQKEEPRAVFMHCYKHALNLASSDPLKGRKLMKDALDIVYEIMILLFRCSKRKCCQLHLEYKFSVPLDEQ